MKVKEESEKADLEVNIQKANIMASGLITSWQIDGETMRHYFLGLQNHCRWCLLTKVCLVKAMIFPVVMYGCESWTIKMAEY